MDTIIYEEDDCDFINEMLDSITEEANMAWCPWIMDCCKNKFMCDKTDIGCVIELDKDRKYIISISKINFKERKYTDTKVMLKIEGELFMGIVNEK